MRILTLILIGATAFAEEPSPPPYSELLARQEALEAQLKAQDAILQKLLKPSPEPAPLAGFSQNFFLRDKNDWFVLMPKGRINIDWFNFLNRPDLPANVVPNSLQDQRPKDGVFIRRARVGISGTLVHFIDFRVEGDFASVASGGQYAVLADASMVINASPYIKLEAGQFYAPFTLENPTSENYVDFMEKSTPVRFVVPTSRETGGMVFGEFPRRAGHWWIGVFDGDGQNFRNLDNKPAVISRAFVSPLSLWKKHAPWMEGVWFGGSFWWQQSTNLGGATQGALTGSTAGDLANFTTQGTVNVFTSNYSNGQVRSHLASNGTTVKWALELNVPIFNRFGLRAEYVNQSIDFGRYDDLNLGGTITRNHAANGRLDGWGSYVEAYAWIGGDVHPDKPGLYQVPHWNGYRPPFRPTWAIMLAAKYEHVELDISRLPTTVSMGNTVLDPAAGKYSLDTFELGGSLWVTRNSRFMVNYALNYLDGSATNITRNIYFKDHIDHELLFRLAVHL